MPVRCNGRKIYAAASSTLSFSRPLNTHALVTEPYGAIATPPHSVKVFASLKGFGVEEGR